MSVNSVNAQIASASLELLSNSTSSDKDLEKIKSEVKNQTSEMSAQQIANKYDITLQQAKQILKDLETGSEQSAITNTFEIQKEETIPEDSTVAYRV